MASNIRGSDNFDSNPDTLGKVLQVSNYSSSSVVTSTSVILIDDTIPQITEGTEAMSTTFTPKSATSILRIDVVAMLTNATAGYTNIASLFRDSGADAIGVGIASSEATRGTNCTFTVFVPATAITSTTFSVRIGTSEASTVALNGSGAVRIFGGKAISSITITEIGA